MLLANSFAMTMTYGVDVSRLFLLFTVNKGRMAWGHIVPCLSIVKFLTSGRGVILASNGETTALLLFMQVAMVMQEGPS